MTRGNIAEVVLLIPSKKPSIESHGQQVIMPQEELGDVRQDGDWGSSGELGRALGKGWEAAYLE